MRAHKQLAVYQSILEALQELDPGRAGWGAIGRAAEFLISHRGLHS